MSDLTGWCVVADERVVASCLTWENAVRLTFEGSYLGLYNEIYVLHSSQLGEIQSAGNLKSK